MIRPSQIILSNSCGNVSGIVYADFNNNCIYDAGELLMNQRMLLISNTSNSFYQYVFTDTAGFYSFNVLQGYAYDVTFTSPYYIGAVCPSLSYTGISSFPSVNNDFGINCAPGFDLGCYLSGTAYRPGINKHFYVIARNTLCQTTNGTIKLLLDSDLTFVNSNPAPSQINGDTLIWSFNPLSYQESFLALVNVLTDTQTVLGSYIHNTCFIDPVIGRCRYQQQYLC